MSGVRLLDYWSPPEGAGRPVACLATSFTFESDFFTQDCLSRFLSLSSVRDEGDPISSIAAVLEEEDRLSEAQVTVLVDRTASADKRNLRWDLLPVNSPGGLLHAKVAALVWDRTARIILGSPNLTAAGYRRQVELALAIDLDAGCRVPRPVLEELIAELRRLVGLAPGPVAGAKARALATVDLLTARLAALDVPRNAGADLRLALAPARPGVTPLDRLPDVWRGPQPLWATVLSPYWGDQVPSPAIEAVRHHLTGRPASQRALTLVVAVDPFAGTVQAPSSLAHQQGVDVVGFHPPDSERRALHAKLVLFESDEWVAALIGSSNATEAGLGLDIRRGHHELNLWIGCPAHSATGKHLRGLARAGEPLDLDDECWEAVPDEDEPTGLELPLGFVRCVLEVGSPAQVRLELAPGQLPGDWEVRTPAGAPLLTATAWRTAGAAEIVTTALADETLPAFVLVRWLTDGDWAEATWIANVDDRTALPPPAELAELPVGVLLAALASTRPLPVALEHELRRRARAGGNPDRIELDALRRFDGSGLLLHRARHLSLALWRLQERLARPTQSFDALHWRLYGAFGPLALADALVRAAADDETLPGEPHFVLAEIALTVAAVDWRQVAGGLDRKRVRQLLQEVVAGLAQRLDSLGSAPDAALDDYVRDALKEAEQCVGR